MTIVGPALNVGGGRSQFSDASSIAILLGAATTVAFLTATVLSAGATGAGGTSGEQFAGWGALSVAGGTALVATVWLLGVGHPISSMGLSLVSLAWVLPRLSSWTALPPRAQVILLSAPPLAVSGGALLAAGWSRTSQPPRLAWVAASLAAAASIVLVLGYDPFFDPACRFDCTASPAPLAGVISVHVTIAVAAILTLGAAVTAVGVALLCTGPGAVRGGAAVAVTLVAVAATERWSSWSSGRPSATADRLEALGTATAALAAAVALFQAHTVQRRVRRVVAQLVSPGLIGQSGRVVRDIHFAIPADDRWVDSGGQEVVDSECGQCAVLSNPDGPSVHLAVRRWEQPDHVLAAVTPAARLALENARLHAVGLARLVDLRASQRRIVEVADVERRRIERDLHDGAQQRLVAVRMHLASARTRSGGLVPDNLQGAETHVRAALTALRELSHDSLGSGLVAEGLVVAVEELLATTSVQVDLRAEIDETHFSAAVAMTAYLAIAEGCKNLEAYSGSAHAQVTLLEDGDGLVVRVLDEGRGGAVVGRGLTEIADRVGALAGQFVVDSPRGEGTRLTVRLPCES
jgi:signal transduction histidine kinase